MVFVETKNDAITRIEGLVDQVSGRFAAEDDQEQQWLTDQCSPRAAEVISRMSVHALHLIDAIPADETVNIVGLARSTGVPKGTVSKIVSRFTADELVARDRLPGNRKEVHLRLTELGAEIQQAHRGLHREMGAGVREFLQRYDPYDLEVIGRVLTDLARMPREGLRFRPDLLDAADDDGDPVSAPER